MPDIIKLVNGFRIFKSTIFQQKKDIIKHLLRQEHKPTTLVISCVDLRMSPSEIFATNPGDLYVINNIGGLVPKYDTSGIHGIMASIEYAVKDLQVQNIIILGHAKCDSIKMMMSDKYADKKLSESMQKWLSVAESARDAVKKQLVGKSEEEQISCCERESVVVSLKNLIGYPYIAERIKKNNIQIFGLHFNIEHGEILCFNDRNGCFESI
jgi:carbonic anhydrase